MAGGDVVKKSDSSSSADKVMRKKKTVDYWSKVKSAVTLVGAVAVLLLAACTTTAEAHGFMKIPLSRNKMAHERGEGNPVGPVNYCPHCNNLGGRRTSPLVFPETIESARGFGLCGDAPQGPARCWNGGNCPEQEHMPGGRFFTPGANGGGRIAASYVEGDIIDVV